MTTRTFNRVDWEASLDAWRDGRFDLSTWRNVRHQAAMKGMIYPPTGEPEDSIEDAEPSQRAIVYRALRETPNLLTQAIDRASSWHGVVEFLLARITEWREEIELKERDERRRREAETPSRREATETIGALFVKIADSVGVVVASSADGPARKPSPTLTVAEGSDREATAAPASAAGQSAGRDLPPEPRGSGRVRTAAEPGAAETAVRQNGATVAPPAKE